MKTWVFNETMLDEAIALYVDRHAHRRELAELVEARVRGFLDSPEARKLRVAQLRRPPPSLSPAEEAAMAKVVV